MKTHIKFESLALMQLQSWGRLKLCTFSYGEKPFGKWRPEAVEAILRLAALCMFAYSLLTVSKAPSLDYTEEIMQRVIIGTILLRGL